jgi:hypothetical protein
MLGAILAGTGTLSSALPTELRLTALAAPGR